jgi:hypothetical protein
MPEHENQDRLRAERLFTAREKQKADAPQAVADYYAAEQKLRDRTQELRQLRLARETQMKRKVARSKATLPAAALRARGGS